MFRHWRYLIVATCLLATLAASSGCSSGATRGAPELPIAIPQSASAYDNGVRLDVGEAIYAANETIVVLYATVDDVPVSSITSVLVGRQFMRMTGFGSWTERATEGVGSANRIALWLPEITEDTAKPTLTISRVSFNVGTGIERRYVDGTWRLELDLPDAKALESLRQMEDLGAANLLLPGGETVTVTGERTASATTVRFTMPRGYLLIRGPELRFLTGQVEGGRLTWSRGRTEFEARFPPTPYGAPVEFRLGIMAMRVSEETEAFRVDLHALGLAPSQEVGEALEQLGRDLGGDGEPLRVEFGEDEGFDGVGLTPMKWIRFVVDGAWHAELHAQPGMRFADADGSPLEIRGLGVSYSESGGRWGATTEVQARFTAEHDMSGVTLELPGRQEVVGPTEWIRLGAP